MTDLVISWLSNVNADPREAILSDHLYSNTEPIQELVYYIHMHFQLCI